MKNEMSIGREFNESNLSIINLTGIINGSVTAIKNDSIGFPCDKGNQEIIALKNISDSSTVNSKCITFVNK